MKAIAQFSAMLLACTALQAFAQASIKLRILQKGSGDPIGRAEIKVGADKTYTDPKGEAQVTVPQGEGVVEIYKVEFEAQKNIRLLRKGSWLKLTHKNLLFCAFNFKPV